MNFDLIIFDDIVFCDVDLLNSEVVVQIFGVAQVLGVVYDLGLEK